MQYFVRAAQWKPCKNFMPESTTPGVDSIYNCRQIFSNENVRLVPEMIRCIRSVYSSAKANAIWLCISSSAVLYLQLGSAEYIN